ncbi:MAG: nuclear transport factor 2 family protein [Kordiimonadaceae bacterium]|nr:nuclear transport factor 2 family protein [Kordiimonadaceae bacterium]MBO6569082.1 nuclear transport factor 2 family protein [Kordiimonadaceae bacterium]MBO6964557.1 nuclear transport factor 2 family protein [Kordiimonadaceae bacterium]
MKRLISIIVLVFAVTGIARADDKADVSAVLSELHDAASKADWPRYFALYTDDAIFLGTDATERWDKPTFQAYAGASNGWTYRMTERNIDLTPDGDHAWFDELLVNEKYGTSRGTGVVIRTPSGWKIAQYHLVFPIPNDLAEGITQQIQTFEARQKSGQN